MGSRQALMVVNSNSRSGGDQCLIEMRQILQAGGIEISEIEPGAPENLSGMLVAQGRDKDLIIVGGGDGTLNTALEAVVKLGKPLGLLPLGTANDFARTLGIIPDMTEAANVIVAGKTRDVDLGRVNDKLFVNVSSMGLSVEITNALTQDLKKRLGRFGYVVGAWRAWRKNQSFRVRLTIDGQEHHLKALQVAVGNGVHFGGGMTVAHDAAVDDQRLDIFVLKPMTLFQYVMLLPRLKAGRHGLAHYVETWKGRAVSIETSRVLDINTDGEITTQTPARYDLLPGKLKVFVP